MAEADPVAEAGLGQVEAAASGSPSFQALAWTISNRWYALLAALRFKEPV